MAGESGGPPDDSEPAAPAASAAPPEPPAVAAPLPLLGAAVGLLAAAGFLHGTGSSAGSPHFPVWLLLLGMGVIVLGGGVAVLLFGNSDAEADRPRPLQEFAAPPRADPAVVADEQRRANLPEPPRPASGWSATGSGATPTLSAAAASVPAARPVATNPEPRSPPAPTPSVEPARTAPSDGVLRCATCGDALRPGSEWRRCRHCGKSLCVKCLTDSVRRFGSGYCASCAPRPA